MPRCTLQPGDTKEVTLDGYAGTTVDVCWDTADATLQSDLYYITYDSTGILNKSVIVSDHSGHDGVDIAGSSPASGAAHGYTDCVDNMDVAGAYGLRIKSLYAPSNFAVFSDGVNDLPYQGYQIISKGELATEDVVKVSKRITAYRSFTYLPSIFDFVLYSELPIEGS